MIPEFEKETAPLNDEEKAMLPLIIKGFESHLGEQNAIKSIDIINNFNEHKYRWRIQTELTGARLRKFVNHIRSHGLLPLIATSKGYYVSYAHWEIEKEIQSLEQRARGILIAADGLKTFLKEKHSSLPYKD